jgi:hypothetical protein
LAIPANIGTIGEQGTFFLGVAMRSMLFCAVLCSFVSVADAKDKDRCLYVTAKLSATFGVCPADFSSPLGLCSAGTLRGFPWANTRFRATNAAYSAGMPDTEAQTTLSYTGELEVRDRWGSLTFKDVGLNDSANAVFSEIARVSGATGLYKGYSGTLQITGRSAEGGLTFEGDVRGKLCR